MKHTNYDASTQPTEVIVLAGSVSLEGTLKLPRGARGIVVFAHGSGSSRLSPRNSSVAESLNAANLGTLLFDLLTPSEQRSDEATGHLRFDVGLLAARLIGAVDWLAGFEPARDLAIGLFGASTGAAAALVAAAERPEVVRAVVSRGGRPDLADEALSAVQAPTLLIVGGRDAAVIALNRQASRLLNAPHQLKIVAGASHLFEEPGTLDEVCRLARDWFEEHLPTATRSLAERSPAALESSGEGLL
jgi:putative phosphoribosyl transferase